MGVVRESLGCFNYEHAEPRILGLEHQKGRGVQGVPNLGVVLWAWWEYFNCSNYDEQ